MKALFILLICAVLITACGPSQEQIQQAIQGTQIAAQEATAKVPTATTPPTSTPQPTETKQPTNTLAPKPTATDSNDAARQVVEKGIKDILLQFSEAGKINSVTFGDGRITIEYVSTAANKGALPSNAFSVALASSHLLMKSFGEPELKTLAKGEPYYLKLVTISKDGTYRYVTESSYDLCDRLSKALDNSGGIDTEAWSKEAGGKYE